ncbi:unnamed protein product [Prorocentrum cordatum]|uniref:Uncharacterized protein n=1 Tax=Prorocentrum cordatum TaxID=2364126 RepID=A0ABN9R843_9DINO|nr:unnamed protein product [Polarella glacialis]
MFDVIAQLWITGALPGALSRSIRKTTSGRTGTTANTMKVSKFCRWDRVGSRSSTSIHSWFQPGQPAPPVPMTTTAVSATSQDVPTHRGLAERSPESGTCRAARGRPAARPRAAHDASGLRSG